MQRYLWVVLVFDYHKMETEMGIVVSDCNDLPYSEAVAEVYMALELLALFHR